MTRDFNQAVERKVRLAATSAGTRVRKTAKGFEIEGDATKLSRFYHRLDR